MKKIIVIASDHNGVESKEHLKNYLKCLDYAIIDIGPYKKELSVDYVDYASQIASIISNKEADSGILICGTGVGMSIVANRFKNVRAVLAHNELTAVKSREHNDSNLLCLGAWLSSHEEMEQIACKWLNEKWGEGRHVKRVEKIDKKTGIVLTNGVFDLLHKGHLELLKFAKSQGDKLIVAIDSDSMVKKTKGNNRPINNEEDRRKILESNRFVDEVIVFDSSEELQNLYKILKPDTIIKGSEWTEAEIRERDKIPDNIRIKIYPLFENYSTTETVKKIHGFDTWKKI